MFGIGRRKTEENKIAGAVHNIACDLDAARKDFTKLYGQLRKSFAREIDQAGSGITVAVKKKPLRTTVVAMGVGAGLAMLFARSRT